MMLLNHGQKDRLQKRLLLHGENIWAGRFMLKINKY